ncbi:hypothetical protein V5E38_14225 [Rossellomorea sp. GAMAL-10_SWC]
MKISERFYPHPVLSPFSDDILNSKFEFKLKVDALRDKYIINFKFNLVNSDLKSYINLGLAVFAVHIECPTTRTREMHRFNIDENSIFIDAHKLDGKVEISAFVLAINNISHYVNKKFNLDYSGRTFEIFKGDVLAVAEGKSFTADKDVDELKNLPSIFTIWRNDQLTADPFDVDLEQDNKIVIKLSKQNFEYYAQLAKNNEFAKTLATMLILPTLVSILEQFKRPDFSYEQYEEFKWFRIIERKLKSFNIYLKSNNDFADSSIVVAQKLIGDPLSGSLKDLFDSFSQD